uniref:Uncharacterized protein n=1 Tax=Arundo donax TaxID=35708 RepID=A0A0A9FS81_ARUDO
MEGHEGQSCVSSDSAGIILLSLILCLVWLRSSAFMCLPLHLLLLSSVWLQVNPLLPHALSSS